MSSGRKKDNKSQKKKDEDKKDDSTPSSSSPTTTAPLSTSLPPIPPSPSASSALPASSASMAGPAPDWANWLTLSDDQKKTLVNQRIVELLAAFKVIGYNPAGAFTLARATAPKDALDYALVGFFMGRITQKKLSIRPLIEGLKLTDGSGLFNSIEAKFGGGKKVEVKFMEGTIEKKENVSFSQFASACLAIMHEALLKNDRFAMLLADGYMNSSPFKHDKDGKIRRWTYESYVYLTGDSVEFIKCIAHQYARMAVTPGYIAPNVEISFKIRAAVIEMRGLAEEKNQKADVVKEYDALMKESGEQDPIPFGTLEIMLSNSSGRRNDDKNVTGQKNQSLQATATAALTLINKLKKKKQKERTKKDSEDD